MTKINEIEEAQGFEHGILDAHDYAFDARHLAESNERAWGEASDSYREGYEAGWAQGQPNIDTGRLS